MICLSIGETDVKNIEKSIKESPKEIDLFEIRLDLLENIDKQNIINTVSVIEKSKTVPVIYTLRSKEEGGLFSNNKDLQFEILREILKLNPNFLDIELGMPGKYYKILNKEKGETKLICSYHNFKKTLSVYGSRQIIRRLAWTHADILKYVTTANSIEDNMINLQMIDFTHRRYKKEAICFCMGEKGVLSRAITKSMGGYITFVCKPDKSTAPGQVTAEKLLSLKKSLNI